MSVFTKASFVLVAIVSAVPICAATLGISADGRHFTINGVPTFLNGISYYAGLSANSTFVTKDLDDIKARHLNWIRVWTFWGDGKDGSFAALTREGEVREPYMGRLKSLIEECNKRELIVDVTMSHGNEPAPGDQTQHLACAKTLAKELKPYRNVYIDVSNERDVGDARFVSVEDVGKLITAIKSIDPTRICTASGTPGSRDDLGKFLTVGKLDFIATHLGRDPGDPAKTVGRVREFIGWMKQLGRRVPIHLQEPFRRGYTPGWEPAVDDYFRDCTGAKIADAAGWCLHNGSNRNSSDHKPQRSFRMTDADGRLFDQLDEVERIVAKGIDEQIGGVKTNVLRYQVEYKEQAETNSDKNGQRDGSSWRFDTDKDELGHIWPTTPELPAGKYHVTWRMLTDEDRPDDTPVADILIRHDNERAAFRKITYADLTRGRWQEFSLDAVIDRPGPLELMMYWPGNCGLELDWVTLSP